MVKNRIFELDFLRGIGIIFVVIYHTLYDLQSIYGLQVGMGGTQAATWAYSFTTMLILVSGASAWLGRHTAKRGMVVLACAYIITLATTLALPSMYIRFGILHMMGFSMLITAALKKYHVKASVIVPTALFVIVAGIWFYTLRVPFGFLYPLGLISPDYMTIDHYPLMPFGGIFLLGYSFSMGYYCDGKSPFAGNNYIESPITFAGRHSLTIYMLHQPLVLGALWVIFHVLCFE